jgi:hypothetical protein
MIEQLVMMEVAGASEQAFDHSYVKIEKKPLRINLNINT